MRGYLDTVENCARDRFSTPPYPISSATNGDYFQSPFTTLLFWPFSLINRGFAKLIFAGLATFLLLFILKSLEAEKLSKKSQFFLLLLFTHALSDVYLALNPLFLSLGLLWICHVFSLRSDRSSHVLSGVCLSFAILIRVTPALLLPFFLFSSKRRSVLPWTFFFLVIAFGFSYIVLPDATLWWSRWFRALPLYSQAASVLSPAFQSPMAVITKWLYSFGLNTLLISQVESVLGLLFWAFFYVLSFRAEKTNQKDLAFSFLLAALYCAFSRVWASAFLYCLPLFILTLRRGMKLGFAALSILYALLPQWLYPRDLWNYLMSNWALQGLVITALIVLAIPPETKAFKRTEKHS